MAKLKFSKKKAEFEAVADRPSLLIVQTYDGLSKKELERYVFGLAEKYSASLRTCYYQIVKFEKGYIVELQSGGNQHGILKTVLKHLEENESAVVEISGGKKVMVTKKIKSGQTSITTHTLTDNDDKAPTTDIVYIDRLNPIVTNGYALWRFSIAYAVLGVMTMIAGSASKFIINDITYTTNFAESGKLVPLKQINDLVAAKPQADSYISALKYENGKWSREEKKFQVPEAPAPSDPNASSKPEVLHPIAPSSAPSDNSSQQTQDLQRMLEHANHD